MSMYVPYDQIVNQLNINKGDVVCIGSDLTRLAYECFLHGQKLDLNKFIESFQLRVGPTGTLLFPVFNWGFCSGEGFDYKNTPSKTGALSQAALRRDDFSRTKHPIYSFAVWGKDRELLVNMNNTSSFGTDSPFGYLHRVNSKMIIIGLDFQRSFTFAHYVEEVEGVNYRYLKAFSGDYVDHDGILSQRTYSMYVRDLDQQVETDLNPIGHIIEAAGACTLQKINETDFYVINLSEAYNIIQDDIRLNGARNLFVRGVQ